MAERRPSARAAILSRCRAVFEVDPRALAAMRVALGALVLVDLALRSGDLVAFYTDAGVLPRAVARAWAPPGTVSLYDRAGGGVAVAAGFAVHALAAAAMLVGWRTRIATIATWVLTVSLHGRNPWVLQGGDDLLRALLFWGMLLPLGARFGLDARRAPNAPARPYVSLATAGLLVQVAAMYAVTSLHKTGPAWRDGSAVWLAIAHDHFGRPWAQSAFLSRPELLRVLCRAVLVVERVAPVLLLAPVLTVPARRVALVGLALLQLGFGTMLYVAHFPWVSTLALLPFVPAASWDALEARLHRGALRPRDEPSGAWARAGRVPRLLREGLAGAVLSYVVAWSVAGVAWGSDAPLGSASAVGVALGLDATWTMFAPEPARDSGWFVLPGELSDGTTVDLFPALSDFETARPVTYEKPPRVFDAFPGQRWLDYLMVLTDKNGADLWASLSAWICRGWNAHHDGARRLERLEISFLLEEVTGPSEARPRVRRIYFHDTCR